MAQQPQKPLVETAQEQNLVAALVPEIARARVEIDEFVTDNAMTNLFLLALESMYKEDPNKREKTEDWYTYYSIASIHGLPEELWNNVPNGNDVNDKKNGGYCTHGSLVFPTWHRVHILMFETAVANKMRSIANEYTDSKEKLAFQHAASRFRLPFWDPMMPRNVVKSNTKLDQTIWGLPKILAAKEVWVKRPKGTKLEKTPNPLYSAPIPSDDVLKQKKRVPVVWPKDKNGNVQVGPVGHLRTIRTPGTDGETNIDKDGEPGKEGLNLKIQRQAQSMGTKLWKLLSRYNTEGNNSLRTWEAFARHWKEGVKAPINFDDEFYQHNSSISLETWHDDIHDLIGIGTGYIGHMGDPSISGFEPMFWLHHNNVDRILAIYQALYPDKWVPEGGTWYDGTESSTANLFPFRQNVDIHPEKFWNSNNVRDWRTLGFAVPGNQYLDTAGKMKLETYLHENYYWTTESSSPPASVSAKWPKDLSSSVALYGEKAGSVLDPSHLQFEALLGSTLITRKIPVAPPAAGASPDIVEKEKDITFKDETGNRKLYPHGALQEDYGQPNITMRTWNATIQVEKFAFNGSFIIHMFIGEIDDNNPQLFVTKKNEVGFSGIFASSRQAPCANCVKQRDEHVIYEDSIPLTTLLPDYLVANVDPTGPDKEMRTLESLEPEHIVPFLQKYLNWRITDLASNPINDPQQILNSYLTVSVWDRIFEVPTVKKRLGTYFKSSVHKEITKDKIGGYGYGNDTVHTS